MCDQGKDSCPAQPVSDDSSDLKNQVAELVGTVARLTEQVRAMQEAARRLHEEYMQQIQELQKKVELARSQTGSSRSERRARTKAEESIVERLTDDIVGHVLSFLPNPSALARCSLVCRRWKRICDTDFLWKSLCERTFPIFNFDRYITDIDPLYTNRDVRTSVPVEFDGFNSRRMNWKKLFSETLKGRIMCIAQVLDKHYSNGTGTGLMMSAYDAVVSVDSYEQSGNGPISVTWKVRYLLPESGIERAVFEEEKLVPTERLRRVPSHLVNHDPRKVHADCPSVDNLQRGMPIEIQFRFRDGDPFGWWVGSVVDIRAEERIMRVAFTQYSPSSEWRYEHVLLGGAQRSKRNESQAATGGFRVPSPAELQQWRTRKAIWEHSGMQWYPIEGQDQSQVYAG